MANTTDIFNRAKLNIEKPITADMVMLHWSSASTPAGVIVAQATNFTLQYQQPVNRRWTLGGAGANTCVIYPGRPIGSIQIQRLFVDQGEELFTLDGFDPCGSTATITVSLDGTGALNDCGASAGIYTARGAIVTSYGFTAEAEGLTVVDNINVEFMQLDWSGFPAATATNVIAPA